MRRVALALSGALVLLAGCGAATRSQPTARTPLQAPGPKIDAEEEYTAARANYEAMPLNDPARPDRRAALEAYLVSQIEKALAGNHLEEAFESLALVLTLYDANELKGRVDSPRLRAAVEQLEQSFRRRGAHKEVIVSLAALTSLTPEADAAKVRSRYDQVTAWLRQGTGDENTPDGRESLIEDLEVAARLWPSPFVVGQLTPLYLERSGAPAEPGLFRKRLRSGADLRDLIASSGKSALAYDLVRLYARVSRLDEATAVLRKLAGQPADDPQIRAIVERAAAPGAGAVDQTALAALFIMPGRDNRDISLRVCRDAERRFPQAVEPRLCSGKFALSLGQLGVAQKSFEGALTLDPNRVEAWELLGRLYQQRLFQMVSDENLDEKQLAALLTKVEQFNTDAQKRFPDKNFKQSMADAFFEVGRGYFNAGRIAEAIKYLERSVATSPTARAFELEGQIKLKKGDYAEAKRLLEEAIEMPRADKNETLWWRAKLRRLVADAVEQSGDPKGARELRKAALADWEMVIGLLTPEALAEAHLERGKLHYQLTEREQALNDFAKAIDASPDRGPTYADAIAWLVARGELEEALDAYHRALGRNEVTDYLKVYCSLWILDLAKRAKQPEDPLAAAYLKSTDGVKWYDDLARWATGREPEGELVKRATTPAKKSESAFYRAMRAFQEGKVDEARALWKQVLDTDMMAFFEYDMAAYYLKLGTAPAQPVLLKRP